MTPTRARSRRSCPWLPSLSLLAAVGLAGCGAVSLEEFEQVTGEVPEAGALSLSVGAIAFQEFDDDVGTRAATESRALIRSRRGYQEFFGHAPPASVDFSREWVIFYAAGTKPTGGYDANILALIRVGRTLLAVTQLISPGAGCAVTQSLTAPHVLVKFAAQPGSVLEFRRLDVVKNCEVDRCAAVSCAAGTMCDPATGTCVPKPPMCGPVCQIFCEFGNVLDANGCPTCQCNPPPGVRCGGIAGIPCPGAGMCVDDPSDDCDPTRGGADCGGLCRCVQNVLCPTNMKFDGSPAVCACVPAGPTCGPVCDIFCEFGNVLDANGCPTCQCNPPPDPCATVRCASGTHCEPQQVVCVRAPCPPIGVCVPDKPAIRCGGIAGIPCPGAGMCVDDPSDTCDPNRGGADCGGICQCSGAAVLCPPNSKFDSSPAVCACVPVCGPVCAIFCEFGNVPDANGCPTCRCNPPPACAPERCPRPAPAAPNILCPDGKTVGGPACVQTAAGTCGWTIVACPAI